VSRTESPSAVRKKRQQNAHQSQHPALSVSAGDVPQCWRSHVGGVSVELTPSVTTTLPTMLSDAVDHDDASSSPTSAAAASPDAAAQSPCANTAELCEVYSPRSAVALVPCGHSRFCTVPALKQLHSACPICRSPITMVLPACV